MTNRALFELLRDEEKIPSETLTQVPSYLSRKLREGPQVWRSHPLGFFVSRDSIGDGQELRLHVWPSDWTTPSSQTDAELHDHIFTLWSLILLGEVSNEIFSLVTDPLGKFRSLRVSYAKDTSGGSKLDEEKFNLEPQTKSFHKFGETYKIPAGIVHRGGAVKAPAITLLATEKSPIILAPRIILAESTPIPPAFERVAPNAGEWNEIVATIKLCISVLSKVD